MRIEPGSRALGPGWRPSVLRWPAAWLFGLGVAVVGMLVAVDRISERHVVDYAPTLAAASRLGVDVASSHVWLEEHITGDPGVNVEADVMAPMAEADELIEALLSGGLAALGGPGGEQRIEALAEPALRRRVERIDGLLERFRALATTRVSHGSAAGAGSPLDRRYDAVFRTLLDEIGELETSIARRLDSGRRRSRLLFAGILFGWAAVVGGAIVALAHRERRRRRTEAVLAEREAQLGQAQKLEAVGRLAGGLAHDVNNYLAAINAQCGLVRLKRADDTELGRMLDEIGDTVQRISNLLVRLLAFSRNRPLAPRVVDLNELASEMGGMMRRLLGDDVTLALDLDEGLWPTEIDPVEVEQVLVNLLVNAREAMPRGGQVTLGTRNVRLGPHGTPPAPGEAAGAGEWVVLSVADRGEGIPDEVRERIFEPFFSTKGRSGHSGLGLATVYGVARRAGGFVRLESTPGEGSRFEVHLPRTTRASEAAARTAAEAAAPAATRRARLLLVDDNPVLADAAAAFLSQVGHRVTRVRDGRSALNRLDGGGDDFDAVVTDLVLPGASGREIAERALALGLPVVMVSAFPDRIEIGDLLLEPRVRFLGKPFEPEALLTALGEVLGTRRERRRAPAAAI